MNDHERFVEDENHEMTHEQIMDVCMEDRYGFSPAYIAAVEGGWHCFEFVTAFETWERQV